MPTKQAVTDDEASQGLSGGTPLTEEERAAVSDYEDAAGRVGDRETAGIMAAALRGDAEAIRTARRLLGEDPQAE